MASGRIGRFNTSKDIRKPGPLFRAVSYEIQVLKSDTVK